VCIIIKPSEKRDHYKWQKAMRQHLEENPAAVKGNNPMFCKRGQKALYNV